MVSHSMTNIIIFAFVSLDDFFLQYNLLQHFQECIICFLAKEKHFSTGLVLCRFRNLVLEIEHSMKCIVIYYNGYKFFRRHAFLDQKNPCKKNVQKEA
jgi:hypothetical protein